MKLTEATAREIRSINPSQQNYLDAVDYLYSIGWFFKPDATRHDKPAYSWGWWINPDHPIKCRPVGDGGNFHLKAWDTIRSYVAQ